jgi:hypothetical protein
LPVISIFKEKKEEMHEIEVQTFSLIENYADEIFTSSFMRELEQQLTNGPGLKHPLSFWWNVFLKDKNSSERYNKVYLRDVSARFMQLILALNALKDCKGFERLFPRLKDPIQFFSARFEAIVAAGYLNMGYYIEFSDEAHAQAKVPDFFVFSNESKDDYVTIECKSLNDDVKVWESQWVSFFDDVQKFIRNKQNSVHIHFEANCPPSNSLLTSIDKLLDENLEFDNQIDNIYIKSEKLSDWNVFQPFISINYNPEEYSVGSYTSETNLIEQKNPILLSVKINEDPDCRERILHSFKKARKQIPNSGPGLVYIELPFKTNKFFLESVDLVYGDIYNRLYNDTKRVNVIVLTGTTWEPNSFYMPLLEQYYFIGNVKSKTQLPIWFKTLGTSRFFENELPKIQGTIEMTAMPQLTWNGPASFVVYEYISPDTLDQIVIRRLNNYTLRLDFTIGGLRRKVAISSPLSIKADKEIYLLVSWTDSAVYLGYGDIENKKYTKWKAK